ncbi:MULTISPECIES: hypothetical protein [unclassified Oceanobacillus]|uniref:hypothetical protein n=1 Tax=unclassified Oceanobacillus TaxID=2630292 RepID=UPI0012EBA6AA|nr:hypothetical protein [Oceanobacillus sp. AG]
MTKIMQEELVDQCFVILFSAGILIHYFYGNSGLDLLEGLTQNLAILSTILLTPLIFLPLEGEGVISTESAPACM